jgi:hypothetical protein
VAYQVHQPAVPNADDKWTAAEHHGNLLLFFPTEVRRGIKTSNGDADAVACARVVNLDTGRVLHNTLIFGTALVPNIGPAAPDGVVAGRLSQGEGKPGQSKPWILLPHDEQELRRVQEWLALDAQGAVTQPQGQAPAQGGWGQQAPSGPPAQQGWGQAPAPASPAPATGGWGAPAPAPAPAAPQAGWGAPAPAAASPAPQAGGWGSPAPAPQATPAPAPAASPNPGVHPNLVEALRKKGVTLQPGQTQQDAESIWGYVANNPDVA